MERFNMKQQTINLKGRWNKTDTPLKVIRCVKGVTRPEYGAVTGWITYNSDRLKVLKLGSEWFLTENN